MTNGWRRVSAARPARHAPWQGMGFKLESLHLYRKVPRDLTDATASGGAISLACALVMAYLFISNINEYLKLQTTTDVALDDTGEVHMRIFFNITMVRAPPPGDGEGPMVVEGRREERLTRARGGVRRSGCRASSRWSTWRTSWARR